MGAQIGYHESRPGHRPWHKRINWTWNRVKETPPIPPGVAYDWKRAPLFGHYNNGYSVFGPYERPILDATGGGQLYTRQLPPYHGNTIYTQTNTPVAITGDGSELTGSLQVLPLVNVTNPQASSGEIVGVSTVNGVTNITIGNTTNG